MFGEPRDALSLLQRWYVDQCDTALSGLAVGSSKIERSEHDWVHWWVAEKRYEAACGPTNLNEAILTFLDLAS